MISFNGDTHPGCREHNEDCFAADNLIGLGVVADGMGGYACGEVASLIVKQTLVESVSQGSSLSEAITRAHFSIKEACLKDPSKNGMGSTVIAAKVQENDYEVAWVGDSRAYLWDGQLKQITRDHSYVESLIETGEITPEQALNHPNKNLITQAVGAAGNGGLDVSVIYGRLADGQVLLLCSDGLVDELPDQKIAHIINQSKTAFAAVTPLINAAVEAGGRDNITVVMAKAEGVSADISMEPKIIRTTSLDGVSIRHNMPAIAVADSVVTAPRLANLGYQTPKQELWQVIVTTVSQYKWVFSCCVITFLVSLFFLIKPH